MRLLCLFGLSLIPLLSLAAPKAEPWPRWTTHNEVSTQRMDHSAWDGLLQRYVVPAEDGLNRFRYDGVTPADRKRLADYIGKLQAIKATAYSRAEQRAFWINLYNAATISVVLEHYPVKSIREIKLGGLFSGGPWQAKWLSVEGEALSLDDIEHRILRPIWQDPLTHYAVNCASIGCPNLANRAYTVENTRALAEAGARAYINSQRGVWFKSGKLYVSSIYKWFRSDFGDSDAAVIAHLRKYATPELAKQLDSVQKISGDDYDWALNAAR